ncbi:hypothetical protein AOLI_G00258370 [Acnodon oligacanthus]
MYAPKLLKLYRGRRASYGENVQSLLEELDEQTSNIVKHRRTAALKGLSLLREVHANTVLRTCLVYKTKHLGMQTASTNISERMGRSQELSEFQHGLDAFRLAQEREQARVGTNEQIQSFQRNILSLGLIHYACEMEFMHRELGMPSHSSMQTYWAHQNGGANRVFQKEGLFQHVQWASKLMSVEHLEWVRRIPLISPSWKTFFSFI